MKDIEIKISKETREVYLKRYVIGNDAENLQGNLVFTFQDEFVKGQARLEYRTKENEAYLPLIQEEESYVMPIKSAITKQGQIFMQLVITEGIDEEEIPIFKSNVFFMTVNESINAELEDTNEYITLIDVINTKLNQIDNLDITVSKVDGVATITVTDKYGNQESVEIYDGDAGTGGGTTDYENLENKPSINDVELSGNKTLEELNIQPKGDYLTSQDISETDIENWNNKSDFSGSYNDLADKPTIPTKTSELTNDSGFLEEENDPTVPDFVKNITEEDINKWNNSESKTLEEQGIFFIELPQNVYFWSSQTFSDEEMINLFQPVVNYLKSLEETGKNQALIVLRRTGIFVGIFSLDIYSYNYSYKMGSIAFTSIGILPEHYGSSAPVRNGSFTITTDGTEKVIRVNFNKGNQILTQNNTVSYSVLNNYTPAHKKYVDDSIASAISSAIGDVNSVLATLTTVEESE